MLSKKRKVPRIVKKRKRRTTKHRNNSGGIPKDIADASVWSLEKTTKQNYEDMGLVMNSRPSMRQSDEGKALLSEARVRLNKAHYAKQGLVDSDDENPREKV